jgi:phosphotriesterase-related protein
MHEHLRLDLSREKGDADCLLDDFETIRDELKALSRRGLTRIVDLSCRGMGRDYAYLDAMEASCGVKIVISTGFYKEPFLPPEALSGDAAALAALFVSDIRDGCEGSSRRASLIGEIGTSRNIMTEAERKVFSAAAMAHRETGAPISTHTTLGTLGYEQAALLMSLGVDPSRLVIGHLDLADDLDLIIRVLDLGAYVEFDTVGKLKYLSDLTRADFIAACCARGYSRQLLLSMDITRRSHLAVNGGPGYAYLLDAFLPLLRERGVPEASIDDMLERNPDALLGA